MINQHEKIEKTADFLRSIGSLYDDMGRVLDRVACWCVDEAGGYLDRDFARETLWGALQKLKQKAEDTPPPFLPPVDEHGLPPIPEGESRVIPEWDWEWDESCTPPLPEVLPNVEDTAEIWGNVAFDCLRGLEYDLLQLEGAFFGGEDEWITGESAYPLIQLEATTKAMREICHERKACLETLAGNARKVIADEACQRADAAEVERKKEAERAGDAEAKREKAEREKRKAEAEKNKALGRCSAETEARKRAEDRAKDAELAARGIAQRKRNIASDETRKMAFEVMDKWLKKGTTKGIAAEIVLKDCEEKGMPIFAGKYEDLNEKQKKNRCYSFVKLYNRYWTAKREAVRKAKTNSGP